MAEQKYILSGLDLSALTSASQEQIMQAINGAEPLANIGFVYVGTSRPDITNNPEMIRFLWLDITDPAAPVFKRYIENRTVLVDADLSWTALGVASGAITTAMMAARSASGGVHLGLVKANSGYSDLGAGSYIVRVATNGKDVEAVTLDTALSDGGGVALARIATTGIGTAKYLKSVSGALGYGLIDPSVDITSALGNRISAPTSIAPGTANYFLVTNGSGTAPEWASFLLSMLPASGAVQYDELYYSGTEWAKRTPSVNFLQAATGNSGVTSGSNVATGWHAIPHGLGAGIVPKLVRAVLICTSTDLGYAVGDEVDLACYRAATTSNSCGAFSADGTYVYVSFGQATGELPSKTAGTGAWAAIDETKWYPKIYAWR